MNTNLVNYYRDRAKEYEKIYFKPERQVGLLSAQKILQDLFKNKQVLEIACGTGYWTEFIAHTANSIHATDINPSVIEIAKQKKITNPNAKFEVGDFNEIEKDKTYESLFGGFIWSHIGKQDLNEFYRTLNKLTAEDGLVVLMDNSYVEGSNHPLTDTDDHGNTYQTRELEDGSRHKVLKNFATESFLKEGLKGFATDLQFVPLKYFWILSYKPVKSAT